MADEESTVQNDKAGLGGMKLIIIIALVVIVVGAGGFFLGKMLAGPDNPKETELATENKTDDGAEKKNDAITENAGEQKDGTADHANPADSSQTNEGAGILVLEKFTVNLNDPFGRRYAEILINLKIDRKSVVSKIQENELILPQIRDEIFMIISSKSYPELNSVSGKVTLKEEIMIRVNELIKESLNLEPVQDVFFGTFIIQ